MVSLGTGDEGPNNPPRVLLSLAWDIDDTDVTITRRDPDGPRPVRGAEPLHLPAGSTTWTGYDYEAPFGPSVVYEARGADGTTVTGGPVTCTPGYYPNNQGWTGTHGAVWLRHLTNPALSMPIDLANAESPAYGQTQTTVAVLNRASPIVLTDTRRKNPTTTLDVRVWSQAEADALRELLSDNSVLLLGVPASQKWGLAHSWIAVGEVTEERLIQEWAGFEPRVFHLPVQIVDRPVGGALYPSCCYWWVDRRAVTYLQVAEQYATYAELAACTAPTPTPDTSVLMLEVTSDVNGGAFADGTSTVLLAGTVTLVAGTVYWFSGSSWFADGATLEVSVRYLPGVVATPGATAGILGVTTGQVTTDAVAHLASPGDPQIVEAASYVTAASSGVHTVFLVVRAVTACGNAIDSAASQWAVLHVYGPA